MTETAPTPPKKRDYRLMTGIGLAAAALVIALGFALYNAAPASAQSCPAQPEAAKAIDDAAQGELAALQPTATGRGYSDLSFVDETGRPLTLADFSGKPLLVNFWATWCVPCREEMPALNALAAEYDVDEFAVIPVNLDSGSDGITKAQKFLDEENLPNLPLYADPALNALETLKANAVALGLPATLLIDAEGCEIAVLQGPAEWHSADGKRVVDALISVARKAPPAQ